MSLSCSRCVLLTAVVFVIQQSNATFTPENGGYQYIRGTEKSENKRVSDTLEKINLNSKTSEKAESFLADATLLLQNGYTNATKLVAAAEKRTMDGILAAEEEISQLTAAKQTIQQGLEESGKLLFNAGVSVFQSLGEALAFTNDGSRNGLEEASKIIQKVGYGALRVIEATAKLTEQGINAGGDIAKQGLNAARESIEAAYTGLYTALQMSHQQATKAIIEAKRNSVIAKVTNQNSEAAARDPDASSDITEIEKTAKIALNGCTSANIVNELKEAFIRSIGDIAIASEQVKEIIQNVNKLVDIEPTTTRAMFLKQLEVAIERIHNAVANVFLGLGAAGLKSGKQSSKKIGEAITIIDQGKVEVISGLEVAVDLALFGIRYQVGESTLGIKAALEAARFSKLAFYKRLVEAAKIAAS